MTQIAKNPYNYCMDFLKGLACIFVVFIHVKFPGIFGQAVQAVARFAVPFFFMVSGYFYYRPNYQGVIGGGKKILHILKIFFFAYLFYIIVAIIENLFLGGTNSFDFSLKHILWVVTIYMLPSNVPGQLWFLLSLLEVYIIWFIIDYYHQRKLAYILASLSLIAMILLGQGAWLAGHPLESYYYRNTWTEGFFFFTLGYFLHDKQKKLTIGNTALILIILFSALLSIVERFVCGRVFAVHLNTFPLVIGLFIYSINNSEKHVGLVQRIGKKYSNYVYILHMFWWHYFDKIMKFVCLQDNTLVSWLRPIIVLGLTIFTSMGCYFLFNHEKSENSLRKAL